MAVNLCPVLNWQQSDANSVILANGTIETYLAGSSTPATTYSDPNGTTPQANPIVLNVRGEPANLIYLTAGLLYKFIRKDGSGNVIGQPLDYIRGINDVTATSDQFIAFGGVATYISATSFSLVGDQTSTFHVGIALKLLTSGGTVYAKILSSAYTTLTTITLQQATGALDAGITGTSPSYGLITNNNNGLPASIDYRVQNQSANYALATGTATAVTASPSPAYGAVAAGQAINLTMPNAATGVAMTLQLTGQAALPVKTNEGLDPTWPANFKAILELNTGATQWILKNQLSRVSIPVRQTVLSGAVDANGLPSFGGATGSTTVTTSTTLIATTANGFDAFGAVNRIGSITNPSWTSLSTNGTMYLYLDIAADGTCTTGSTTLAPVYQFGGTYSVTNAQFTFNIQEMVGKVGNGSVATQTHRLFVGEVTVAGAVVTAITWYALQGKYVSAQYGLAFSTQYTNNHNIGVIPQSLHTVLVNTTTEFGYVAGERLFGFGVHTSNNSSNGFTSSLTNKTLNVGTSLTISIVPKAGGAVTATITAGSWKLESYVVRGW